MIKKLQKRFIRISVLSLSVAMIVVVVIINLVNWFSVRSELKTTLDNISRLVVTDSERSLAVQEEGTGRNRFDRFSQRLPKETNRHERNMVAQSNWYCALYSTNGEFLRLSGNNNIEEDDSAVIAVASQAIESRKEDGRFGDYFFKLRTVDGGTAVILLNCETRLTAMHKLMLISSLACIAAIAVTFVIVSVASRKAVAPTVKNMEQQKQFITNASHELKTPLTVISTNMELLDMEIPGNNWVTATKKQTSVMRHLVDELVYLSRMEEENAPLSFEEVSLESLLKEASEPFEAMAEYSGREFNVAVEPGLTVRCDRASIQRLLSTLLDNAMKYAAGNGSVEVSAKSEGKSAFIEVSNEIAAALSREQCEQLFDRFFRADPSRNKEKQSGFGIGLAIARAIAEKHGGAIEAKMVSDKRLKFICRLPMK